MNATQPPLWLFQRLRWQLLRNNLRVLVRHSFVRILSILFCSAIIWGGLFAAALLGFRYLRQLEGEYQIPLDSMFLVLVFNILFLALTVLLIFSTGIILYSSLFGSPESYFLLSLPVREDRVFAYKFQGAVAFSSWAFVLLGSPILIAYGLALRQGAPWYFYAVMPLFFLGFVLLPGSLGALACLAIVNFLPKHRKQVLALLMILLVVLVGLWIYKSLAVARENRPGSREWFTQLLREISVVNSPWVPAQWIAKGLQAAALGQVESMAYHLTLVWSNGLFLYVFTAWAASYLYRRGFNRVATGGTLRKRYGGHWIDAIFNRALFFLDPQTRLLFIKDFRTFRRDPAQWAQILIFLGLAGLYFSQLRHFYSQDIGSRFQNGISLLTLTATSFLMCAYNGRFIFPMLSLEGRKFWILGLLPLQRERLLWGKFIFSASGCLIVAEALVIFSNIMLNMPWQIVLVHMATVAVLTMGLSGLSVGLGACLPNFRETDPSKIAVGFGGTLNLVAGLLFLLAVIALMAAPFHLVLAAHRDKPLDLALLPPLVWLAFLAGISVGVGAVVLPMRAGSRNLKAMEF